jgi:Tfp pilus assembly protein PilE
MMRRAGEAGLTVTELMNFVAIAAVLAGLGMYGMSRYIRRTKTVEATGSVAKIAAGAASYYNQSDESQPKGTDPKAARATRHFPPSSKDSVPAELTSIRGKQYQSNAGDWAVTPWREMNFQISPSPQFYAYSFKSDGAGNAARAQGVAHGDLDGDGHLSTFSSQIAPNDDTEAIVSPTIEKLDPEE